MTREEAIEELERLLSHWDDLENGKRSFRWYSKDAVEVALSALRPFSREQVILCKDCQYWQGNNGGYPHPECRWGNDETPDEDDYCSFAERLEVNKNGSTWEEIRD